MSKILHLIPTLEGGGAERQLSLLASKQSMSGWSVHVGIRRVGVHEEALRVAGVTVHLLGDFRGLNPILFLSISSLIRDLKPDVVQTWLPQMDVVGGAAALWRLVPLVLTERTSKLAFDNVSLPTWLRKYIGRHANAVVANSSSGASYWQSVLSKNTMLKIIKNAVDVAAIQGAAPIASEFTQNNQTFILVVGRLIPLKAVEIVLQAVSLLAECGGLRFLIMGEGSQRKALEELIGVLKIGDRVVMLPFQSEWWGWLQSADALVSMSRYEGNPNVVLEAMAAGCPLIVSDITAHREILTDESASFVPVDNSIALAAAIKRMLADPDSGRRKADLAKHYVDSLTIQSAADAYEEVYASVCREKVVF